MCIRHITRHHSRISSLRIIGQGSRCSGTTWLFDSTPIMETVEKICKIFDISSPDYSLSYTIRIIGLVDDKGQYANDCKETQKK